MSQPTRDIHAEISAMTEIFFRQLMREFCTTDCKQTVETACMALRRARKNYKP
jgi:hypothetical protein